MAEIDLSDADNGRTIKVRPGDSIVLSLGEVAGAGYAWTPVSTSDELLAMTDSASATPAGLGGGNQRVFTFRATRPGDGEIELLYRRPWEPADSAEKRFSLKVVVEAQSR